MKACFVNPMWQPGESINFTAADHVTSLAEHAGMNLFDHVVVNTRPMSEALLKNTHGKRPFRWRTIWSG